MKKLFLMIGAFRALSFVAVHAAVIDQSQPAIDTSTGTIAIGGNSEQKLAQVVTMGLAGDLTGVGLPVSGSGTLFLQVEGVSGGAPNGVTFTSQAIAGSSLPDFFTDPTGFRRIDLAHPYHFSPGEQFAVVLSALNAPNDSFGLLSGPLGNPYPGGDAYFSGQPGPGTWVHMGDFGRSDLPFQTFVQPVPEPAPWIVGVAAILLGIGFRRIRNKRQTNLLGATVIFALARAACSARAQERSGKGYLRLDAGIVHQQDLTIKDSGGAKISYDNGFRFDFAGGGYFNQSLGAEVEIGLMHNSTKSFTVNSFTESLDHYQIPMLVSLVYKLPIPGPVTVRAGAGIGGVYSYFWGGNIFNSSDDLTFGYQGMLGVDYAISKRCDLGVSYKFLGTTGHDLGFGLKTDGSRSHALLAALTIKF